MIEELVARAFASRNAAHLAHWKVHGPGSYAQHMALEAFYSGVIDLIDKFVEMHQGAFGLMEGIPAVAVQTTKLAEHIAGEAAWIEKNREKLSQDVCALENVLDEIVGLYLTTYYKLKNLA